MFLLPAAPPCLSLYDSTFSRYTLASWLQTEHHRGVVQRSREHEYYVNGTQIATGGWSRHFPYEVSWVISNKP